MLVEQAERHELDEIAYVHEVRIRRGRVSANDSENLIPLREKQLGQERPVLPRDTGDQRPRHARNLTFGSVCKGPARFVRVHG